MNHLQFLNQFSNSIQIKKAIEKIFKVNVIKINIINKQRKYVDEMDKINSRLTNKNFVDRAPKHIVDQEKNRLARIDWSFSKLLLR